MNKYAFNTSFFAGLVFILVPILIQIPYTILILDFEYPDILRMPTEHILLAFQKGGSTLILTWWFFGFSGLPLVFSYLFLYERFKTKFSLLATLGTIFGISSLFFQLIGLLRWVFVVPILAKIFVNPKSTPAMKDFVIIAFQIIHYLFGVLIGEHLGQLFTILWMGVFSILIYKDSIFPKWLGVSGLVSSFIYLLAQFELFALIIPEVKEIPMAGLIGSLCWLFWMIALGVIIIRKWKKQLAI